MSTLFGRRVQVQFDTEVFDENFRIEFTVNKKLSGKDKLSAKLKIYNPNPGVIREALARKGRRFVGIRAGHGENLPYIIAGFAVPGGAFLSQKGPDTILEVAMKGYGTGPAARARPKRFRLNPAATYNDFVDAAKSAFGVPIRLPGDIQESFTVARILAGEVFQGSFDDFTSALERKLSADAVFTGEEVVYVPKTKTQGSLGPVLSRENGTLLESPVPREKGKFRFQALLIPALQPGYRIIVQDGANSGVYKVTSLVHKCDSGWAKQFYTSVDAILAPVDTGDGKAKVEDPVDSFQEVGAGLLNTLSLATFEGTATRVGAALARQGAEYVSDIIDGE